ncbi:other/FunK1 protein kinase [Coprinopsis cinerea okayama7|uniref:Other/FunK1 protein kinase n=1 Tax=Coprinopsis cinerea (strain Okayama-7 / 130 / ATCC MYA-4618 / FGSC 9003) TaxID=240176 RepID=D6RQ73_COPC7|nr:other/FunK1 protein kinase [Coprinopsis cinerea okayama7\|eukprot:XP_002910340.1 other/FunK1 protein kinase [Coprinopsis cinerea okayama7\
MEHGRYPTFVLDGPDDFLLEELLKHLTLESDDHSLSLAGSPEFETRDDFLADVNATCQLIRQRNSHFHELLVFRDTSNHVQAGNVSDTGTKARPSFVAGLEGHWYGSGDTDGKEHSKSRIPWPAMRLAGEITSKGKNEEDQRQDARTYLDLLLDARPDFKAAFGLLVGEKHLQLLVGQTGSRIYEFSFAWGTQTLKRAMLAMVYRLYDPGQWAHPDIEMVYQPASGDSIPTCVYNLTFQPTDSEPQVVCRDFICRYGANSFGTRTHVFHGGPDPPVVDGHRLRVVKIQLCHKSRFDEIEVLRHVKGVPGVVDMLRSRALTHLFGGREEVWIGMGQEGAPFMSIETPREMLMVAYDALEITRILNAERRVLHRDISTGNVMYLRRPRVAERRTQRDETPDERQAGEGGEKDETGEQNKNKHRYCFVRRLLGKSDDPKETSTLLIDFNHSEVLSLPRKPVRGERTGTPGFMARAVHRGEPLHLDPRFTFEFIAIPNPPETYKNLFPGRLARFSLCDTDESFEADEKGNPPHDVAPWRHQLYHDAESIFWLVHYWALMAMPSTNAYPKRSMRDEDICIPNDVWTGLLTARKRLPDDRSVFHPSYRDLFPLLKDMYSYMKFDPHWLPQSSPRAQPDYIHECFQRIILNFLQNNWDQPFMSLKKSVNPRSVYNTSLIPSRSSRPLSSAPTQPGTPLKRSYGSTFSVDSEPSEPKRARVESVSSDAAELLESPRLSPRSPVMGSPRSTFTIAPGPSEPSGETFTESTPIRPDVPLPQDKGDDPFVQT